MEVYIKKIPLTQGKFALVDNEDYPYLNRFKWSYHKDNKHVFRQGGTSSNRWIMYMEFLVKRKGSNDRYFFKNGNPYDLRKSNLEVRSLSNSAMGNRKTKILKTSKYRGVCWDKRNKKWCASLTKRIEGKRTKLLFEFYENEREAARKWNKKAKELYGEYAYQNKII